MKKEIGLVCLGLAIISSRLLAESSMEVNVNPGYAIPIGDSADFLGNSPALDGSVFFKVAPWLKAGLQAGYIFGSRFAAHKAGVNQLDNDVDGIPDTNLTFTSDVDFQILHVEPAFKVGKILHAGGVRWEPYFTAGGGPYWIHNTAGTVNFHGTTSGGIPLAAPHSAGVILVPLQDSVMVGSGTDFNLGFDVGGGLSCLLTDNVVIGADLLYRQIIYQDAADLQFLIPSLRLAFEF
jgi:hypothetical protein